MNSSGDDADDEAQDAAPSHSSDEAAADDGVMDIDSITRLSGADRAPTDDDEIIEPPPLAPSPAKPRKPKAAKPILEAVPSFCSHNNPQGACSICLEERKAATEWMKTLIRFEVRNKAGAITGFTTPVTTFNIIATLRNCPMFVDALAYDELREREVWARPVEWSDTLMPLTRSVDIIKEDHSRIAAWFAKDSGLGLMQIREQMIESAIGTVAAQKRLNPIVDYLKGLKWDGVVRLPTWLHVYTGAEANDYTAAVGRMWMIGAVRRALFPGCKFDSVLVLEGRQGSGKSSLVRVLAKGAEWLHDSDIEIGDKDAAQALRGKWIVELPEMHSYSRAHQERVKAWVTRAVDTYRPSFGRTARDFPRRWIAMGTTNASVYLTDDTGNRRWLPVKTTSIDIEALTRDVDQLWAEAVMRVDQNEPAYITDKRVLAACEAQQEDRRQIDPWEPLIANWLANQARVLRVKQRGYVTISEVLDECLDIKPGLQDRAAEVRVGSAMRVLEWVRGERRRIAGERCYPWYPPGTDKQGRPLTKEGRLEQAELLAGAHELGDLAKPEAPSEARPDTFDGEGAGERPE